MFYDVATKNAAALEELRLMLDSIREDNNERLLYNPNLYAVLLEISRLSGLIHEPLNGLIERMGASMEEQGSNLNDDQNVEEYIIISVEPFANDNIGQKSISDSVEEASEHEENENDVNESNGLSKDESSESHNADNVENLDEKQLDVEGVEDEELAVDDSDAPGTAIDEKVSHTSENETNHVAKDNVEEDSVQQMYMTASEETLQMHASNYDEHSIVERNDIVISGASSSEMNDENQTISQASGNAESFFHDGLMAYSGNYVRHLVVEAIEQFEADNEPSHPCDQAPDSTTSSEFQMDIQAEVAVATSPSDLDVVNDALANVSETPAQLKRTRTPTIKKVESYLNRGRCKSVDIRPKDTVNGRRAKRLKSIILEEVPLKPKITNKHVKFTKAMKKRQSAIRKTVSAIEECERDEEMVNGFGRNTNQLMFAKNSLYQKLCVFCNVQKTHLVPHYVKEHPNHEVPMARLSPEMATKLRSQTEHFKRKVASITGLCFFCEDVKKLASITDWKKHLLIHTGESYYNCEVCRAQMKSKKEHSPTCSGMYPSTAPGFMCNDCNYLQFKREHIVKHLENEHGFLGPSEEHHYKLFQLVKFRIDFN